jgi:hypothetical protein
MKATLTFKVYKTQALLKGHFSYDKSLKQMFVISNNNEKYAMDEMEILEVR